MGKVKKQRLGGLARFLGSFTPDTGKAKAGNETEPDDGGPGNAELGNEKAGNIEPGNAENENVGNSTAEDQPAWTEPAAHDEDAVPFSFASRKDRDRPAKRARTEPKAQLGKHDASSLVPFYTHKSQVPPTSKNVLSLLHLLSRSNSRIPSAPPLLLPLLLWMLPRSTKDWTTSVCPLRIL
jgi:hypothetical protein